MKIKKFFRNLLIGLLIFVLLVLAVLFVGVTVKYWDYYKNSDALFVIPGLSDNGVPQGFDLSTCCGKQLTRFTFTVTNYPDRPNGVQANLYLCEEQLVAGDILCSGENGFQVALTYPGPTSAS